MKKAVLFGAFLFVAPLVALAQYTDVPTGSGNLSNIVSLVTAAGHIVNLLIPIVIALAIVFFFWGLVQYIRNPADENGKSTMIIGLVSLFIMVSIWGIIIFAQGALGVSQVQGLPPPQVQGLN